MDVVKALTELGGISTAGPLIARTSRKRLRLAVERGDVLRLGRNRYCLSSAGSDLSAVRETCGHLSHLSAAEHHGWEVCFSPDRPQVVVSTDAEVPRSASWSADITRHDVRGAEAVGWATPPVLTVLMCARDLPFRDALAVADSGLRHHDVGHDDLIRAARAWPDRVQRLVAYADGRAANPFESALRACAIEAGLDVVPQYAVATGGTTLHPDLADPLRGIALEADSWTHHGASSDDHDRDCARYNALVLAGWTVLRFTWAQVMFDGPAVVATLTLAREQAGGPHDRS